MLVNIFVWERRKMMKSATFFSTTTYSKVCLQVFLWAASFCMHCYWQYHSTCMLLGFIAPWPCLLLHHYIYAWQSLTREHGWQNRFGRTGDRQTNIWCMVPEKPADAISEVLHFVLHTDNQLLARWVSLIAELKKTMELLCKANGTTLHYVLASFVLFHSVRPQKRLLYIR